MKPCARCNAPTDKTLAGVPTCPVCRENVIGPIRARRNAEGREDGFNGVGRPRSANAVPGMYELICDTCGAGWTGRIGEACGWCDRRYGYLLDEQRHLLLNPDLPDLDDPRYDAAIAAWVERLANAVKAEVITEADVDMALGRHEREDHAA